MQFFFESAALTLTLACSFVLAFIVQKTALTFLLKVMTQNHYDPAKPSRVSSQS
jgi:hypothetical protein